MKIIVIDGQGGGVGRLLVDKLHSRMPDMPIIAVGTNALATSAMLRAGAKAGATGENAVRFNSETADLILGPSGITSPNAMLGEVSPEIATAIANSTAQKFLLPMEKCTPGGNKRGITLMEAAELLIDEATAWIEAQPPEA